MQFLKNNKLLLATLLVLPVCFFSLDKTVILWVRDLNAQGGDLSGVLAFIDRFINIVAHGSTLIGIAFLLYVIGRKYDKQLSDIGRSLLIGLVSAGIAVQVLKHFIGRARPRLTDTPLFIGPSLKSGYDSFPSGHATLAFCFALILSYHLPRYRSLFYVFAIIVGLVRVEGLSHFPSDVLGGAILGTIVGSVLLKKMYFLQEDHHAETR